MAGFQNLKVNRTVDFTGASKIGMPIGSLAGIGIGGVYFVDNTYGADGNSGKDPNYPKATIQSAIDACANWYNDFIFVSRRATTDFTTTTAILMNKHTVHLIGMANMNPQGALIRLVHTNETDNVLEFTIDAGYFCEVAGFGFAGGTTAKGGIASKGVANGEWIHHCNFGSLLTKGTPDYGVFNDGMGFELQCWTIEDCSFYGSSDNSKGLLGVSGINVVHSPGILDASKHLLIRNNIFMGLPSAAVNLDGVGGGMVLNNTFKCAADTNGLAITIGNDCRGCFIDGNHANFGSADAMGNTPWLHSASADNNTWGTNWEGNAVSFPGT